MYARKCIWRALSRRSQEYDLRTFECPMCPARRERRGAVQIRPTPSAQLYCAGSVSSTPAEVIASARGFYSAFWKSGGTFEILSFPGKEGPV